MTCAHCCDAEKLFNDRRAKRELRKYRRKGPDKSTRLLLDALLGAETAGSSLLDIGGGVGAIQHASARAGASGMTAKLNAVVIGAANMMQRIGIPETIGIALMGVFIASFAGTTLDTAVRLQRYIISELSSDLKIKALTNRWTATTFAVLTAAGLAFATGAGGKGAMMLWPLFGIANQLLASLALLVVTMYLKKKGGLKFIITAIPALLMLTIAIWAMAIKQTDFLADFGKNWLLIIVGFVIIILAVWMAIETVVLFFTGSQSHRACQE